MAGRRMFLSPPRIGAREYELVREALDSNYVAPVGPMLDAFEAELAAYTGFGRAVAVSSGTAALHLALRVLGVGEGDRVVVPSLTFIASVTPVAFQGAEPVFVDSDPATWLMDPGLLEDTLARLRREGRAAKAVVVVDLYGQPCGPLYREICDRHGAELIIDAAESLGSRLGADHAGRAARIACLSFNGNKIITTSGGGALVSDEPSLIERARSLSQQARVPVAHYEHEELGYNYRLSNILAAIGRAQLETIEQRVEQRRDVFARYRERLEGLGGIAMMPEIEGARANRWLSVAVLDPRIGFSPEDLRLALEELDIESRPVWKPMHMQPVFKDAERVGGGACEALFARGLCLPSGAQVDDETIGTIARVAERLKR